MKVVELKEIEKLYKDCHVEMVEEQSIRTNLNVGSINNRLNCDYGFMNKNFIAYNYINTNKSE